VTKSDQLSLSPEDSADSRLLAAGIWARATALRDALPLVAPAREKLAGIEGALQNQGAQLIVARSASAPLGFAVLVPREVTTEVLYLAVDPAGWGQGVAAALLDHIREHAAPSSTDLELWVIADNARAVRTYERAGWIATQDVKFRNDSGRPERRYRLSR